MQSGRMHRSPKEDAYRCWLYSSETQSSQCSGGHDCVLILQNKRKTTAGLQSMRSYIVGKQESAQQLVRQVGRPPYVV